MMSKTNKNRKSSSQQEEQRFLPRKTSSQQEEQRKALHDLALRAGKNRFVIPSLTLCRSIKSKTITTTICMPKFSKLITTSCIFLHCKLQSLIRLLKSHIHSRKGTRDIAHLSNLHDNLPTLFEVSCTSFTRPEL